MKLPPGLRPLTKPERRRLARENARAEFPDVVRQRLLITIEALEVELASRPKLSPWTVEIS